MKIMFFIGGLSGGGAERVVCNLASFLQKKGHTVDILTMSDDKATYSLNERVSRTCLLTNEERRNFLFNSIKRLLRLIFFIRKNKRDCIVVFLPITTILLLRLRKLISAKIIASERVDPSCYSKSKQTKLKKMASKADGWVFQTKNQELWYENCIKNVPCVIIPNAINNDFLGEFYQGRKEKTIISMGRLTKQKNHALLIKSFAKVLKKFPDYKLAIYGDGPERRSLEELISALNIQGKAFLPGYSTNIKNEMLNASLFVLSSDYEGMPNALMEAMALGLPCISTDCGGGGAKYLIEDGINGLLIPVRDENLMSEAIEKVLSNSSFANSLGMEAHKICEKLSPEKIYGEWERFILNIVNG